MKARIAITPDGGVVVMIDEGTFEEGRERITRVLEDLKAKGVQIGEVSAVESHRPAGDATIRVNRRIDLNH